jgi:NADPH:quinone reductase
VKAAYIEDFCDASGIRYGELPDPAPGPAEVLIRVAAVAVNKVDTFVRSGAWRTPAVFPLAVGRDLVGTVTAAGAGIGDLRAGDRVWANSAGYDGRPGATAELAVVGRDRLYPLPPRADPVPYVAAVHPGATAYGVLIARARIRPGETVAVIGGNGAVGMCLIQVAAAHGAHVLAVVRDGRAAPRLAELGARQVVVVRDAAGALAAAADKAPRGVDVVVDATGRADITAAPEHVNPRGRIVLIAGTGRRIELDQWAFYTRELHLHPVGAPETLHRARSVPGPEVGVVTVGHSAHGGGYGSAVWLERGEQHVLGRRERGEVAVGGVPRGTAISYGQAVWHVFSSITGYGQ